jgi:predicted nucleotidyltransferase
MTSNRTLDGKTLQAIVNRIVEVAKPERIIMFGSAARDEMGPHSDVDLLVVKRGEFHRGHLVEEIYMNLIGLGQAVDVIVVTPEEIEKYKNRAALVIYPAVREGKVVYAA